MKQNNNDNSRMPMTAKQLAAIWVLIKRNKKKIPHYTKRFFNENGEVFYNRFCLTQDKKRLLQQQVIKYKFPKTLDRVSLLNFKNDINGANKLIQKHSRIVAHFQGDIENEIAFEVSQEMIDWASENLNKANFKRTKRIKDHIGDIVESGKAYFLTLTFKDSVLNNTTAQTRRRYVSRVLKDISAKYIANIDFGPKKGREHYHAVIECGESPLLAKWTTKYGFAKIDKVRTSESDIKRVAKYTAKLTYHTIKHTTKNGRIIYSKT